MHIPTRITAGDTVTWMEPQMMDPQGAPITSTDYTLTFSLRGPTALTSGSGDIAGTASGYGWSVTIASAVTAAMNTSSKASKWWWQAYATKGSSRLTVGSGQILVDANFALLSGTVDGRSNAEQILSQIEATILARTTGGSVAEYTIGNRSLKYLPMADLLALKSRYQLVVSRERRRQGLANGLGAPDRIGIRFR